jgi:hypothetical protein
MIWNDRAAARELDLSDLSSGDGIDLRLETVSTGHGMIEAAASISVDACCSCCIV